MGKVKTVFPARNVKPGVDPFEDEIADILRNHPETTITCGYIFTTYPPMFTDYDQGIENENYDNEIREFSVPKDWVEKYVSTEFTMTLPEFMEEWDWDASYQMFAAAVSAGVLITDCIRARQPGD